MISEIFLMIDMSKLYTHADYNLALSEFNARKKWSIFKDVQLKVSKNKCPICECNLNNTLTRKTNNGTLITIKATIDHYRPKDQSLYPFLKFDHNNYLLMCSECNNAYKENKFPLHASTPVRANSIDLLSSEKPLIVNPILDDLLPLFTLVFKYTPSGKKVLELKPKADEGYLHEQAKETIKVFSLGDCELNEHKSLNIKVCRINLLNDHFKKFYGFIEALANKDEEKALFEFKKYKLDNYGFTKFIMKSQFLNLIN